MKPKNNHLDYCAECYSTVVRSRIDVEILTFSAKKHVSFYSTH